MQCTVAMQLTQPGGKLVTNAIEVWWPNLELMLVVPLMVKFGTNTSGTTHNWSNCEQMQVAFFLAGDVTQVKESIPCGSVVPLAMFKV